MWISIPVSKYCWKSENSLENKPDNLFTHSGLYVHEEKEVIVFSTQKRLSVFLCLALLCAKRDSVLDLLADSGKGNSF